MCVYHVCVCGHPNKFPGKFQHAGVVADSGSRTILLLGTVVVAPTSCPLHALGGVFVVRWGAPSFALIDYHRTVLTPNTRGELSPVIKVG